MATTISTESVSVVKRQDIRCCRLVIDALLGEDKTVTQIYETVNYENDVVVSKVITDSVVHSCTDLLGVVDPQGITFANVMQWALWANDNMADVDSQIAAIKSAQNIAPQPDAI